MQDCDHRGAASIDAAMAHVTRRKVAGMDVVPLVGLLTQDVEARSERTPFDGSILAELFLFRVGKGLAAPKRFLRVGRIEASFRELDVRAVLTRVPVDQ